jgi:hypothetical protein
MTKIGKKRSLKAGDLIRDTFDGTLALVLSPGWLGIQKEVQTWHVLWSYHDEPTEIDATALEKGWVTLVNRA